MFLSVWLILRDAVSAVTVSLLGSLAGCFLSMMCIKRGYKAFIKDLCF